MSTFKSTAIGALAAIGVLMSVGGAFADSPAVATSAVNVRTGPGSGYAVVGQLSAGQNVNVLQQQGSWCYVQAHVSGWSACSYLAAGGGGGGGGGGSTPDVPFNFGVTVGPGGPSFSFGVGNAPPPPPPAANPRVCFYKNANYGGQQWCVNSGTNVANVGGGWNNTISSVRVYGGASVQVCKNPGYGGGCTVYANNRANLNGGFNNNISSFQVY